jgi:hypothetical protein
MCRFAEPQKSFHNYAHEHCIINTLPRFTCPQIILHKWAFAEPNTFLRARAIPAHVVLNIWKEPYCIIYRSGAKY